MEAVTIQKYIHTSPRKLRLVADAIRKMEPTKALDVLRFTPKAAAKDLIAAIKVALANAKQQGLQRDKVTFRKVEINEGVKMRRFRAGTRGRVKPYKRRMAHIKIVLTDDLSNKIQDTSNKQKNENSEIEARTGQSSNEPKVTKGGRTGLSK